METTNTNSNLAMEIRKKAESFFDDRKTKVVKSKVLKSFAVVVDNFGYVIMCEVQARESIKKKEFDIFSLVKVNMTTGEAEIEQNCATLAEIKQQFFKIKRNGH